MEITNFFRGELLEVIEWTDETRDTLCHRFPDEDKAIKRGAQLIVRESQLAQLIYLGEFGDTFGPGRHALTTENIPILTKLRSWKYGFESPFKVDVYFVTARLFTGNRWGTSNPIMMRDDELGVVRARAFGIYDFRVVDPRLFLREVAGSDSDFRLAEFAETMRSRLVSAFSEALANAKIPVFDTARRYAELGGALLPLIDPVMRGKYGIDVSGFVVENVSVPQEVEQAIDARSSMAAVGDLNEYVKFQLARGLEAGGGAGAVAGQLAAGLAIAQQLMQQPQGQGRPPGGREGAAGGGGASAGARGAVPDARGAVPDARSAMPDARGAIPEMLSPLEVARALGVSEEAVMSLIQSGELKAKHIGSSWRIRRAALDTYLAD